MPKNKEEEVNEETDEQKSEREAEEAAEAERKAELEAARKEAEAARIEAATARGEAEATRRNFERIPEKAAVSWTDEQWDAEAAKYGTTGAALKAQVEISKAVQAEGHKAIKSELEAARKEAQEAKEEARRIREGGSREKAEASLYKKNPALDGHRGLVDEFMSSYTDNDSVDIKTYEKRLGMAVDWVKGKVKDKMSARKTGETGSLRLETGEDERRSHTEIPDEFDPRGTGNEGAAHLMLGVMSSFGRGLKHADSKEVWEKSVDDEGRGVTISMDEDIAIARELQDRPLLGGKRGAR